MTNFLTWMTNKLTWMTNKLTWMTNKLTGMTNSLAVAVVDVDEGVLEGSDMSGTHLNGFLVKN